MAGDPATRRAASDAAKARRHRTALAGTLQVTSSDPEWSRLLRQAEAFRRAQVRLLRQAVGAGECGPAPAAMVASAAMALAGSRYAYQRGDVALGAKLAAEVRQHLLGAHELCAREGAALAEARRQQAEWARDRDAYERETAEREARERAELEQTMPTKRVMARMTTKPKTRKTETERLTRCGSVAARAVDPDYARTAATAMGQVVPDGADARALVGASCERDAETDRRRSRIATLATRRLARRAEGGGAGRLAVPLSAGPASPSPTRSTRPASPCPRRRRSCWRRSSAPPTRPSGAASAAEATASFAARVLEHLQGAPADAQAAPGDEPAAHAPACGGRCAGRAATPSLGEHGRCRRGRDHGRADPQDAAARAELRARDADELVEAVARFVACGAPDLDSALRAVEREAPGSAAAAAARALGAGDPAQ